MKRKAVKKAKPTKRPARKSAPKRGARVPKLAVRRKAVKKAKPTKRPARKSAPKRGARVPKLAVRRKAAGGVAPARPPAPPPAAETRLVSQIKVGARFRKDMGDLEALKRSIETRGLAGQPGLLQPIAITPKNELIAGERRLEAWKRSVFRDTPIPVHVVDVDAIVRGEWDENDPALRKNFTPSEMVAIKRALEPKLKAEAAERKRAHGGTAPGKKAEKKGKGEGRAADLVATFAGKSRRSIEKAEKVVEAAERDKARFGDLVDDMDKSGKVDAAFKKLQVRAARDAIKAAPPPLPMTASECATWAIDFPWAGEPDRDQDAIDAAGRAFRPYPEMTIKSVCEFARREIAPKLPAKVSVWLWVTNFILVRGYAQHVIAALGFEPEAACTMLTWDKVKIGRGKKLREQTEHAILLTRGEPVIDVFGEDAPTTLIREPRRENSRKPEAFYRLVERVTPAARYASIFSQGGEGELWDSHGDQVGKYAPGAAPAEGGPDGAKRTVPDLIAPDDIVTTSYGTGPYRVVAINGPHVTSRGKLYGLELCRPDAKPNRKTGKLKVDSWINDLAVINGRIIGDGGDEVFVQRQGAPPEPAEPAPPRTRWCQVCQIRPLARDDHACFTCEACAAAQEHVVAMTIDHVDASTSYDVATCRCGWSDSVRRTAASAAEMDARVRAHWQAVVAEPDRPPELQPPAPPAPADDGLEMPEFLRRRAPDRPTPEAAE